LGGEEKYGFYIMETLKYFTMQKYNLQKNALKRNQNASRYYDSIVTNLKFQHKPEHHLSKIW
jgi:serine protease inhibitor